MEQKIRPTSVDLDGYLSDLVVVLCCAALLVVGFRRIQERTRAILCAVFAVPWTLIHIGNYEHIKAIGAPLQFTYAGYMGDAVFVAGSAAFISRAILASVLLALGIAGSVYAVREKRPLATSETRALVILIAALANAAWPLDTRALLWRQDHFIEALLRPDRGDVEDAEARMPLPPTFRANVRADLDGTPLLSAAGKRPNVLLVILEGISGANIPVIASAHGIVNRASMPKLSAFAEENTYFTTFMTNQRQTNRGEFSLICGQLERLVSITSKMTEYARDGGEACLPNVLADAGYTTVYLQPAPLSFMLKDQFMAKAGYADVRGHDFFGKGYARSSWGIDDRAFLEHSSVAIKELQRQSPWFATLLTVGTHHPYTVPEQFVAGDGLDTDPHARAIRYADESISSFLEDLEKAGILDDTLLLVTSDESFGVDGYDDQTKLLSYNWGFMVVKPPGARIARVVREPHYQADTALSIVDYLGLSGPFVGRSFFRDYHDRPRQLVFANTYQRKVYWASNTAAVECDEDLKDCERHTFGPNGLFGVERVSTRASARDVAPLRELIASGAAHEHERQEGTTQLMQNNAVVHAIGPSTTGLMFGGQYFTLDADQEVVVKLSARVAGRELAVLLDTDIYDSGMQYEVLPPPLYDGDELTLEYIYAARKKQKGVEVRLRARSFNNEQGSLIVPHASMTVRRRTAKKPGGTTETMKIKRGSTLESYLLGSGFDPQPKRNFKLDDCLKRAGKSQYRTKDCEQVNLLSGPYVKVQKDADVSVIFDVEAEKGAATLRADLVSGKGKIVHELIDVPQLNKGGRRVITLTHHMGQDVEDLEARLGLISKSPDAVLIVSRAVLEIRQAGSDRPGNGP